MSKVISLHPPKKRSYLDLLNQFRGNRPQTAYVPPNGAQPRTRNTTMVIQMHHFAPLGWDFFRSELEFE